MASTQENDSLYGASIEEQVPSTSIVSSTILPDINPTGTQPEALIEVISKPDEIEQKTRQISGQICSNIENNRPPVILDQILSDKQRETDNKSPEEIIEEQVNKLNISKNLSHVDKMLEIENKIQEVKSVDNENKSLKNLMEYNDSDSDNSEAVASTTIVDSKEIKQPNVENNNSSTSGSETDSFSEDSETEPDNNQTKQVEKNIKDSGSSDSESDSASTLSSDSDSDDTDSASVIGVSDDNIGTENLNKPNNKGAVKKTNITGFEETDFVPIPDLSNLHIQEEIEFMHIGSITYIVAEIATISVIPGTPAFDLDSMLFIENGNVKKPMGPIFDVIGPVADPIYCVRFNSEEDIKKMGLKSGMKVFAAPKSEEFTKYVFLQELLKLKHSDASYRNDTEVPLELAEFSDDEKERDARRKKVGGKRKIDNNSLERHKRYEQTMNKCNNLHTKFCKMIDAHKNSSQAASSTAVMPIPPDFNPAVPPPGFGQHFVPQPMLYASPMVALGQPSMYSVLSSPYQAPGHGMYPVCAAVPVPYASQPVEANSFNPTSRRGRHYQRQGQRQNSENYYTNNSRNYKGPGPSSQPF